MILAITGCSMFVGFVSDWRQYEIKDHVPSTVRKHTL